MKCTTMVATKVQARAAVHVSNRAHRMALVPPRLQRTQGRPSIAAPTAFLEGQAAPQPLAKEAKPAEVNHVELLLNEIATKKKVVIAQVAPAVRVAIGEELGLPVGTAATGKLVSALRLLGFDYVFDVLAGADVCIMEEGTELLHRVRDGGVLPMLTSCCPGWIELVEKSYPEMIPHLSSAKSPHMMEGALIKEIFSEKLGIHDTDICMVSIMPCVRKQGEADRIMYQTPSGAREIDHVLTTKEISDLIKAAAIDFPSLPDAHFDNFMGLGSGAGAIFGTTGGVMEAALRTVVELASGQKMEGRLVYEEVRGLEGIKEATVTIPANPEGPLHNTEPMEVNVAVANGLGNAKKLLKAVADGTHTYHFVEVMACPGGCIGGGGQPRSKDKEILKKRQAAIYAVDERKAVRRSYENPVVQEIYAQYLGEPCGDKAHELLHTHYAEGGPEKFDITAAPPPPPAANVNESVEGQTEE